MPDQNELMERFKKILLEFEKIKEVETHYLRQKELLLKEADELGLLNQKIDWELINPWQKDQLDKIKMDFNFEMQRIEQETYRPTTYRKRPLGRRMEV
ncbi:MAG: hypothetical protein V2B13_19290 [Pseudomonadota bacterium]